MKNFLLIFLFLISSQDAYAKNWVRAQVFACESEWASLTKEIVGDKANIIIATNQMQDPHFITADTGLINDIRKSDIIFCSGAGLEDSWLPKLLEKVSKPELQKGQSGYLMAADYVKRLEVPIGEVEKHDVHKFGNPHIHLNPHNILPIVEEFLRRIIATDPGNSNFYQKNYENFIKKWNLAIIKWEVAGKKLKHMPIVVKHDNWAYLADWLGLKIMATIEPEPGVAPNIKDLFTILQRIKTNPVEMIIYAPYENKDAILWLSDREKTKVILLPLSVYGNTQSADLFTLFDNILNILITGSKDNPGVFLLPVTN